ncbi:hypothetical protein [Segniliparus rugosus]|uniref:Uncharacterized protein n=1 Tax=Segniliparus rugosus (strain ATCC BAA-974 / DSM 45345 / CCUG 50838 / CIP 108380 / JCM 13579 / CDC 945) TaxID=679197 RepID=E5XQH8_SEGRC|nr:hypothetical protein [Segniliparus rugosus]EFV13396.1 hypothetical protein HMPREF9336_01750 [Segniliparus rugosus ATCC BAA-974]
MAAGDAREARLEHAALAQVRVEDFLGSVADVVAEIRARACAHELIGFEFALSNMGCEYCRVNGHKCREPREGWIPAHREMLAIRDERDFGAHPLVRTVRRALEGCWDRLALAAWVHAEEAVSEAGRYMAAVREWAGSEEAWTAFGEAAWFCREETPEQIGLPVWGGPGPWPESSGVWREPGPEEDPEGKRYLFNDYHARLALVDVGEPGATRGMRERVHEVFKIARCWQVEHTGLPLGCCAELVESWYQYLNWMLLSFEYAMGGFAPWLLDQIEEHRHSRIWLTDAPGG